MINSRVFGISAVGFDFLKDVTIQTLLFIEVEILMKYEWDFAKVESGTNI